MELREFAERVLFAKTLEEKIRPPSEITDEHPGAPLAAPPSPGRPIELRFKEASSSKGGGPSTHRLTEDRDRGQWLHFFANHELLATELMALVLLRFPEAPPAFRRGVLRTLQDEQEHTRLYLERMKQCGVVFGELPVSGYFWRAVSKMESPLDFVTGLSLTFEQANLDFARDFSARFAAAGDKESARLLDRIYRDEIAHVAHGLKWFRRWKDPDQSDWKAFCRQLKFPLSPRRAKGDRFNAEGRKAAGLDSRFINELEIFSQSKGRTPTVFLFNPLAEGYLAQGKSFSPIQAQVQLVGDLENLPQFLCRQDDIVLITQRPSLDFLKSIKEAGFSIPEFVEYGEGSCAGIKAWPRKLSDEAMQRLRDRKLGGLRPWAWGPDSAELLAPLMGAVTRPERRANFDPKMAQLYSKRWSAEFLRRFLKEHSKESWLCDQNEVGVAVNTMDEAWRVIRMIRQRGHHRIVVKEAIGLAGHNAIRLWEGEVLPAQIRWMERAVEKGGGLVIEPWLERAFDFSVQLEMKPESGLKLAGYTELINDAKGQFRANRAATDSARRLPAEINGLLNGADARGRIHQFYGELMVSLERELRAVNFEGPVGLDAFIYRAEGGVCRLKPLVEMNPRHTMGRLLLELMRHVAPGRRGEFRLINRTQLRVLNHADFVSYARVLTEQKPIVVMGEPIPQIDQGVLCLNDPARAQSWLALLEVSVLLSQSLSDQVGVT